MNKIDKKKNIQKDKSNVFWFLAVILFFSFLISGFFKLSNIYATTTTWDFDTAGNYTYDSGIIEIISGIAKLISLDQTDNDNSATGFGGATHSDTQWDTTNLWVELDATGLTNGAGSFISRIMDAGTTTAQWTGLSWTPYRPYLKELPDSAAIETAYLTGNIDMSNNALLFHFNESTTNAEEGGSISDTSGFANNGTLYTGSDSLNKSSSTAQFVSSTDFDGIDDYIEVSDADSLDMSTAFTISAWVKSQNTTTTRDIIRTNNSIIVSKNQADTGYQMGVNDENKPYFAYEDIGVNEIWKYDNSIPNPSDTTGTNGRIPLGTAGKGDENAIVASSVIKDGSAYKMWYGGADASYASRIFLATSSDGLTWNKVNNVIESASDTIGTDGRIPFGTAGKADANSASDVTVIKDGSIYRMWYTGAFSSKSIILSATSSDGLTWNKVNNAIEADSDTIGTDGRIPRGSDDASGDQDSALFPTVIKDDSIYKMWYVGEDIIGKYRIYMATSSDGLTWNKVDNSIPAASDTTGTNGRIPLGETGGDTNMLYYPSVIKDGSTYKMWYGGYGGSSLRIYYATSPDGLTWTKYDNSIPTASDTTGTNGRIPRGETGGDAGGVPYITVIKDGSTYKMWYSAYGTNYIAYYATLETGPTSTTAISNSAWTHLAGVLDSGTLKLYVNGSLDTSTSTSVSAVSNSGNLFIGDQYSGAIDELAVFNRVLSATDIADIYKRGALKLKYQVRSCDDASCSGETFAGPNGTATDYYDETDENTFSTPSLALTNLADNRYFQYKAFFDTSSTTLNVELRSVDALPNHYSATSDKILTTVDSTGSVGYFTSITLGADNFPVISYRDGSNGDLKVAKCGNASCSSGNTITTVDSTGDVGSYTAIILGADDFPVISYYDSTNGDLKVAKCGNASCSSGNIITTVDSTGAVGSFTSITLGADDFPVISYYDSTNGDLKVAKCGNESCSSGNTITTVDSTGFVRNFTSITLGADYFPVISYFDNTNYDLKAAKCGNASCSSGNIITTVDSTGDVGSYTSITLGADDFPVISYTDGTNYDLKVAKCGNASCSSGNTITTVDSTGSVGLDTTITLGADDFPVISYYDTTNSNLKVAKCGNASCSSGNIITTFDSTGAVGLYSSITLGADYFPVISYLDGTKFDLKVAKCADVACATYGNGDAVIVNAASIPSFTNPTGFTQTLGSNNEGTVRYQLSLNNSDWYYWDNSNWVAATTGFDHANTSTLINTNINQFDTDVGFGSLYLRTYFRSVSSSQQVELDTVTFSYDPTIQFDSQTGTSAESAGTASIGITLSDTAGVDTTVDYTISGTAVSGSDYSSLSNGTATVAAGDTTTNITFTIIDDPTPEASETVILTLSSPSNATVGTNNQYTLTITDTDLGGGGFGGQPPPPPPPPPPPEEPPPEETPPEELPPEEAPPEEIPPEEETPPEEVPPEEPPPEEAPPEEFVLPTEPSEPTPPSQPESTSSDGHIPSQPTTSPSSAVAPRPTIVEIIQSPAPTKEKIISVAKVVAKELPIIFAKAPQTIKHSAVIVKQISDDPKVEKITKQIIAPIIAGATLVALSPSFAAAAIPLSKFLFFQPLLFLGFIRRKHWGKIYNTLNKLPVDLATIRLIDAQTNKIVQSKVTDQYGHYGFFAVKPGIYRLEVFKKGFIYPSQLLQGQNVDGRLIDLYFNTKIIVDSQNPNIVFNIPLDPIEKTKKPSRINIQKNLRIIQNIFAGGGLLATFIYLLITNVWYLWLLLGFHLILYLLFLKFIAPKQPKGWGKVYDMTSDKRLNKTIVRLFSKQFNKLIDFHITDNKGRYAFLTGPGQYYVTFEKSGYFKHKMENDLRVKEKEEANLIKEDVRLIRVEVDGDADGMISVDHSPPADSAGGSG